MDSHTVRFRPDQSAQIREARKLRQDASNLRSLVSEGSYGNDELTAFYRLTNSAGSVLEISNPGRKCRYTRESCGPKLYDQIIEVHRDVFVLLPKLAYRPAVFLFRLLCHSLPLLTRSNL